MMESRQCLAFILTKRPTVVAVMLPTSHCQTLQYYRKIAKTPTTQDKLTENLLTHTHTSRSSFDGLRAITDLNTPQLCCAGSPHDLKLPFPAIIRFELSRVSNHEAVRRNQPKKHICHSNLEGLSVRTSSFTESRATKKFQ